MVTTETHQLPAVFVPSVDAASLVLWTVYATKQRDNVIAMREFKVEYVTNVNGCM